jgi:mRNA interferase RelE/StbE
LEITPAAARDLASLPRDARRRVDASILALANNPHPPGVKKLKGLKGLYRARVGDYRVVYSAEHARLVVLVVRIGHRREIYRGF